MMFLFDEAHKMKAFKFTLVVVIGGFFVIAVSFLILFECKDM